MTRRKPRQKKFEFSKLILIVVSIFAISVTIFTLRIVAITGDTSPLAYLIPAVFAELATATGFYYSKAKAENKIKLAKNYKRETIEKGSMIDM